MQYWPLLIPLLLSTVYLLALHIGQPPADLKPKIFVLGLSKTGTTSIGNALALLGYKRLGWKDIRSRHLVHTFVNGDTSALIHQTKYFDAFEDLPWPYVYREVAEMYPDAKFILSLRENEQTWLKSLRVHMSRGSWEPAKFFYGADEVPGNEEVVLSVYRNHTANVREYFADKPDRYQEIVVDDGDVNWTKLCRLAQCPEGKIPAVGFPRSNTAASWHDGDLLANLHRLWGWTLTTMENHISSLYYKHKIALVNVILERLWHLIDVVELAICQLYFQIAVKSQPPLQVQ